MTCSLFYRSPIWDCRWEGGTKKESLVYSLSSLLRGSNKNRREYNPPVHFFCCSRCTGTVNPGFSWAGTTRNRSQKKKGHRGCLYVWHSIDRGRVHTGKCGRLGVNISSSLFPLSQLATGFQYPIRENPQTHWLPGGCLLELELLAQQCA